VRADGRRVRQQIVEQILQPALQGMAQRGTPYVGVLYAGVWIPEPWSEELAKIARGEKVALIRSATEFSLKKAKAA
jgi:hypothetical protein